MTEWMIAFATWPPELVALRPSPELASALMGLAFGMGAPATVLAVYLLTTHWHRDGLGNLGLALGLRSLGVAVVSFAISALGAWSLREPAVSNDRTEASVVATDAGVAQ